jgi:ribosomal protein L11
MNKWYMTRKAKRVSGVVNRRLNMRMTLDVEDIKNSTQDIAMLGQYSVNIGVFVEEAKKVVSSVSEEVKVRLRLVRNNKGTMRVRFDGVDLCSILKAEIVEGGKVDVAFVYNVVRMLGCDEDEEVRRKCKNIVGTLSSMGVEVCENL